ncbi:MAG: rod shape-determining protein MreC [Desulfobacterales bacterium]
MFSRKSVIIIAIALLFTINIIMLSIGGTRYSSLAVRRVMISVIAPFQSLASRTIRFSGDIWRHYFQLVSVARENDRLKEQLAAARGSIIENKELELANSRLRNLLNFRKSMNFEMMACEVIAKDPSSIYRTVIIDKGETDGLCVGLPVVLPEGVVGQIIDVTRRNAKVLLVVDINSSVDALVQRTRARGVFKGTSRMGKMDYVIWKDDVTVGDMVISSGCDGVFPKGLLLGRVVGGKTDSAGIFQEVNVKPFVNFDKLEEVLVLLNPFVHEAVAEP